MNLFKGISLKHHNNSKDIEFGSNSKEEATWFSAIFDHVWATPNGSPMASGGLMLTKIAEVNVYLWLQEKASTSRLSTVSPEFLYPKNMHHFD